MSSLEKMVALDEHIDREAPGWMTAAFEVMHPDKDGWSEWVHPLPGYRMQCCGCGLVHEMETAIVKATDASTPTAEGEDAQHVMIFRMRRA